MTITTTQWLYIKVKNKPAACHGKSNALKIVLEKHTAVQKCFIVTLSLVSTDTADNVYVAF